MHKPSILQCRQTYKLIMEHFSLTTKKTLQLHITSPIVRGIHQPPVDSPHKGPIIRKAIPRHHDIIILKWSLWLGMWSAAYVVHLGCSWDSQNGLSLHGSMTGSSQIKPRGTGVIIYLYLSLIGGFKYIRSCHGNRDSTVWHQPLIGTSLSYSIHCVFYKWWKM